MNLINIRKVGVGIKEIEDIRGTQENVATTCCETKDVDCMDIEALVKKVLAQMSKA